MRKKILLASLVLAGMQFLAAKSVLAETGLEIYNGATEPAAVDVVLKLPGVSSFNCGPTEVKNLVVKDGGTRIHVIPLATGLQSIGYFKLPKGHMVTVTQGAAYTCLQGMLITFGTLAQCPCGPNLGSPYNPVCSSVEFPYGSPDAKSRPNGVNLAEVTLNVPSPNQETVDISCNQGANSIIKISFHNSTGWDNGNADIQNSYVDLARSEDNNCNLTGVFPYNLDDCHSGPVSCADNKIFCTAAPVHPTNCQVQRTSSGGTVKVTYLGPTFAVAAE